MREDFDIDFDSLEEDPEAAYLQIEDKLRRYSFNQMKDVISESKVNAYIIRCRRAAMTLGLEDSDVFAHEYNKFSPATRLQVFIDDMQDFDLARKIKSRRVPGENSVSLDSSAREKLNHYLQRMRQEVERLDVDVNKKEALYKRINALQSEVDRTRTRFEAFGALVIEGCDVAGRAAEKLEPLRKWIDSIGGVLTHAKEQAEGPFLPERTPQKQIEGPKSDEGSS